MKCDAVAGFLLVAYSLVQHCAIANGAKWLTVV